MTSHHHHHHTRNVTRLNSHMYMIPFPLNEILITVEKLSDCFGWWAAVTNMDRSEYYFGEGFESKPKRRDLRCLVDRAVDWKESQLTKEEEEEEEEVDLEDGYIIAQDYEGLCPCGQCSDYDDSEDSDYIPSSSSSSEEDFY